MSHVATLFSDLLDHRRIDGDAENNAIVDAIAAALADVFEPLGLVAFGDEENGVDGARVLTDPRVAPLWAIGHAAMYVGAKLPGRMATESDQDYLFRARHLVEAPRGIRRGTHDAVYHALNPLLTGNKTVFISDNYGGPYDLYVRTMAEETPDPAAVLRALAGDFVSGGEPGAIRAELVLTYTAADYPAWLEATRRWSGVDPTATWANVTREELT